MTNTQLRVDRLVLHRNWDCAGITSTDVGDATSPPYSPTSIFGSSDPVSGYTGSAAGCYFATWVLLTVGCMHSLTDETRAWTVNQLKRISTQAGFTQADDFAKFIESSITNYK